MKSIAGTIAGTLAGAIAVASICAAAICVFGSAVAQSIPEPSPSLWNEETGNRYSNHKAMHVGDIVTVLVTESSQGVNSSSLKTKKESKVDMNGGPGKGPFSFLPLFGVKTSMKDELNGTGRTSLSGELSAKITAEVVEIRPNGHLVIEGSRMVSVNNDEDRVTLHGVARPEDIRADNTILSTFLAEARITYAGKGPASHAAHKGVLLRVLSWIF